MGQSRFRSLLASVALLAGTATAIGVAGPAHAAPIDFNFNNVTGTAYIAKPKLTVEIPKFVITSKVDLETGEMAGQAQIPELTVKQKLFNFLDATSVVRMVPEGDMTGSLKDGKITTTTRFTLEVRSVTLDHAPGINLVKKGCRTSKATSLTLVNTTPLDIWNGTTIEGDYEIPSFTKCGLLTPMLTLLMSGPGNHMKLILK